MLEKTDVVVGGFPCQDISVSGRGAGITGTRSGLWKWLLCAIRMVRPKFAIVENVPMLLGRGMGTVLGDLAETGYDTEWDCFSACEVGAPHTRERVFIMAYPMCDGIKKGGVFSGDSEKTGASNTSANETWWTTEPRLDRVASRVPHQVDRVGCIGNSVVPQVAQKIGEMILRYEDLNRRLGV